MTVNRKVTGTAVSMPAGLGIGLASSLLLTLAMAAAVAWLLSSEKTAMENVGYWSMGTLLASSMLGAAVAYRKIKHRRMLVCMAAGGCYFLSLLAITALFFGGQYTGVGVTALTVAGGAGAVGLLGLREIKAHLFEE